MQFNTYDSGDLPAYEKSLKSMMSPKFRASFDKAITQVEASIKQAKVTSKGQVLKSAVASHDSDSAQVLVVSDANASTIYDPNVARHFRWEVSLVKIDGRWLVDDFDAGALMSSQNPRSPGSRRRIAGERRRRARSRPAPTSAGRAPRERPKQRRPPQDATTREAAAARAAADLAARRRRRPRPVRGGWSPSSGSSSLVLVAADRRTSGW